MTLELDIERRLGQFRLQAAFTSERGITALFGRSGSGKSSLINMIGGLLTPDRGRILVNDQVLFDNERRIDLPSRKRRIGYVFQEARLFPHLNVRQNLLYGRWFTPKRERYIQARQVIELLGIGHLLERRPGMLSGGEKQRIAIGRALLVSPRLLLMDEPLSSLDSARKSEILPYIERLRDEMELPIVYVSHTLEEVVRLANTMVVLSEGQVAAAGSVERIMSRLDLYPLTGRYEAGAVIEARVTGHDAAFDLTTLAFPGGTLRIPRIEQAPETILRVRIRARDVNIALAPPKGISLINQIPGCIIEITEAGGPFAEVRIDAAGAILVARVTRQTVRELDLRPGRQIYALINGIALDRRSLGLVSAVDASRPVR